MVSEDNFGSSKQDIIVPAEEAIRLRSYLIWEREGRPEGCAQEHWIRAKAELEAEMQEASMSGETTDIVLPRLQISTPPVKSVAEKVEDENGKTK